LFLKRWAWKREAKSDEERFELPYEHEMTTRAGSRIPMGFDADDGDSSTRVVAFVIEQARFDDARNAGADGGFASTVWDSAIVLAKFVEKHQEMFRGLRVCELGAGCGLVSVAMLHAGASRVVATDLAPNTPLLFSNVSRNAPLGAEVGKAWDVKALTWGADAAEALGDEPFDLVVATDCMYVPESATALADTLEALVFGSAKRKPKKKRKRKRKRSVARAVRRAGFVFVRPEQTSRVRVRGGVRLEKPRGSVRAERRAGGGAGRTVPVLGRARRAVPRRGVGLISFKRVRLLRIETNRNERRYACRSTLPIASMREEPNRG
jgi:predicted nicotinamide N-methyase